MSQNIPYKPIFHPLEISFCGYSGSGKTTLIAALVTKLAGQFDIGFVKHDAHHFSMDKEGKDTFVIRDAGAKTISIHDNQHMALLDHRPTLDKLIEPGRNLSLLKSDLLFIEGYKHSAIPKIVVLGPTEQAQKILDDYKNGRLTNVMAFIGTDGISSQSLDLPYFERGQIDQISDFIIENLKSRIPNELIGIVLIGGHSKRMGVDKFSLNYGATSQIERTYELVSHVCAKAFVSCRSDQTNDQRVLAFKNILVDQFNNIGPLGAILTALHQYPRNPILAVACDLPMLGERELELLATSRNSFKFATTFLNQEKLPEPLCAIYEPKSLSLLHSFLGLGYNCPRKMLLNLNVHGISNYDFHALSNANTPSDRDYISTLIERRS